MKNQKFTVVTRKDLSLPYQAVQAAHAAINFIFDHPDRAGPWHKDSQYLVFLSVKGEKELEKLINKVSDSGILYTVFREPDIGNEITAVALEPSSLATKLVRNIKLMQ